MDWLQNTVYHNPTILVQEKVRL